MRLGDCSRRCRRSLPRSGACCTRDAASASNDAAAAANRRIDRHPRDARLQQPVVHLGAESVRRAAARTEAEQRGAWRRAKPSSSRSTAGAAGPSTCPGADAWPLTEELFQRVFASREPFWARATRGDADHEVYFLNDRGAIYALGYPRTGAFGHLISLAELLALSARAFVAPAARPASSTDASRRARRRRDARCCARCARASIASSSSRLSPPRSCRCSRWRLSRGLHRHVDAGRSRDGGDAHRRFGEPRRRRRRHARDSPAAPIARSSTTTSSSG